MDFLSTLIGLLSLVVLVAALLNPLRALDDPGHPPGAPAAPLDE